MYLFLIGIFEKIMFVTIAGWMIFLLVPPLILGIPSSFIFKNELRTILRASLCYFCPAWCWSFLSRSPGLKILAMLTLCLYNAVWGLLCMQPFP